MTFNKHPYKGIIFRALPSSMDSAEQEYEDILQMECDVETIVNNTHSVQSRKIYNYTHEVWIWNDAIITYSGGMTTTLANYLENVSDQHFLEGLYFRSLYKGKTISGEIKLYNPSALGIMLGIDTNDE